ncbi:putative cysteine-rich receptor-like protein kinase 9 [Solanum dulcamara]|uniref:putative cysteine-rich receptor-like protein kinase 9 n=1 Tax=Solanum dulcamara TaxID=45834 RepID=UPI00248679B3|nr:putative cysteine-rich receptor-like protein kinase 9 [Solanum dulcamara]
MMLNYYKILLCCILIFFFQVINCQVFCPNTSTYTANSTYSFNLKALLSSLSSNSSRPNGFYNTTSGNTGSDIAYGMFLCRGDVSPDVCQSCVSTTTKDVQDVTSESYCRNGKVAVLWVDDCLIRYSDQPLGNAMRLVFWNTQNVSEPQRFLSVLGNVMNELVASVAANGNNQQQQQQQQQPSEIPQRGVWGG